MASSYPTYCGTLEQRDPSSEALYAPAAERNGPLIVEELRERFTALGPVRLLEVGSGSGQHAARFAEACPNLDIQPSDVTTVAFASVKTHCKPFADRVRDPVVIDLTNAATFDAVPKRAFHVVYACNVVHISPWSATLGLLQLASQSLVLNGTLILYGAYGLFGKIEPESNLEFDAKLKRKDPSFGIRHLEDIEREAKLLGLHIDSIKDMPANNKLVIFNRRTIESPL